MSKITKKDLRKMALKLLPAVYNTAMQTGEESGLFQNDDWRMGLCLDAFLLAEAFEKASAYRNTEPEPQPQLIQLDQSIFDGLEENWRFAAVDGCTGRAYVYEQKPHIMHIKRQYWRIDDGLQHIVGDSYDTSNWQNSLIEREKKELTGSELCKAMLERGDKYVMCLVFDDTQNLDVTYVIRGYYDGYFHTKRNSWENAIPINNQGEPLTAAEVGL